MEIQIRETEEDLAAAAAERIAAEAEWAIGARGRFLIALSGGSTPWATLEHLACLPVDWGRVEVFQVDERAVPADADERNWQNLAGTLLDQVPLPPANLHQMPVLDEPAGAAADAYARTLAASGGAPPVLDVVQLGLGDDGHTASLAPGDPVLDERDHDVAWSAPYRGVRRMTLTYPTLDRARCRLWLVTGAGKATMVRRITERDRTIPAGRVVRQGAVLFVDRAAAMELPTAP